jgi:glycosyltransferase involved in cell wall biosynthesis
MSSILNEEASRPQTRPEISVVVPTHNRAAGLTRLVEALTAQTLDRERFEVIVVDDGSQPPQRVDGDGLLLRVIRHESPRGPSAARNSGWKAARAPLVAFIDDDCTPTASWLGAFLAAADGDADWLIVQGPVVPAPDQRSELTPLSHTINFPGPHPLFVTCNIAYSRALLERVGGFDESFRNACGEDVELGTRAVKAGAATRYAERAEVHHEVRQLGLRALARQTFKWTDAVKVASLHPELREMMLAGVFWKRTHPLLLLAIAGALTRRPVLAAAAAAPYLDHYRRVYARPGSAFARALPTHVAIDLCEIATMVAGSVRHRTLML